MDLQPQGGEAGRQYDKWIDFIIDALKCYDLKNEKWLYLPESGGYYDQDEYVMSIWEYVIYSVKQVRVEPGVIEWVKATNKDK